MLLKVIDSRRLARMPGRSSRGIRKSVFVRRVAFATLGLVGSLRSALHRPAREPAWDIRRIEHFDERFDTFWERASVGFDFIGARNKEFLNWRYSDQRAGAHVVLAAEAAGEVLGYAALRTSGERGSVMDLLTLPGRGDVADSLIAAALEHFRREGCSAVQFVTVAQHPYNRVFGQRGFFDSRRSGDFYCAAMRMDKDGLLFLESKHATVHLTDGDMV